MNLSASDKALFHIEDLLERSQIKYFLIGKTAKQVIDDPRGDLVGQIEIGVRRQHMTEVGLSSLKMIFDAEYLTNYIIGSFGKHQDKVDIKIKIINKNWKVLENPDTVFFKVTQFQVPNPFKDYWKIKQLVK